MTKCIGFGVALVAAVGVTLATPASSDACHRGYGYYGGNCCYSVPVNCCWTNFCYYRPVVPCCQTIYYSGVVPSCYCYDAQGIVGTPVAQNTFGVTTQTASNNTVQIHVAVPAGAKVWFNDSATQQGGTDRLFTSPPLTPGFDYTYEVKAQWVDQTGKEVTQVRQVTMRANAEVNVSFLQSAR
jgi:uncharacterized protein (TIGR03000 family)